MPFFGVGTLELAYFKVVPLNAVLINIGLEPQ